MCLILFYVFFSLYKAVSSAKCVGHRGYSSKYPENTMMSMKEALMNNGSGIEMDLRLTKDNFSLERTTNGTGLVNRSTYKGYVEYLKAGESESVPLLIDLLIWILYSHQKECTVILDVKNDNSLNILTAINTIVDSLGIRALERLKPIIIIGVWD
ncbi:PLC-like phosphodiesterase, TIM beta/alpha-barrel domain-containing protein, partial [Rozella allomycis CSF55]